MKAKEAKVYLTIVFIVLYIGLLWILPGFLAEWSENWPVVTLSLHLIIFGAFATGYVIVYLILKILEGKEN